MLNISGAVYSSNLLKDYLPSLQQIRRRGAHKFAEAHKELR